MTGIRVEAEIAGKNIILETGKIAKQADGSVWVQCGGTVLLVTAVSSRDAKPYQGFFPLTVDYRERAYAAGKIPGGFFKREGRPYEHEVLRSRLIDRPLRPMFPDDYNCETQILAFVISFDQQNDADVLGILGASVAVAISDIPIKGQVGGVRVVYANNQYIINPTISEREFASLDIVVAGTGTDIVMVEGNAHEVSEEILFGALQAAMPALQKQIELQQELVKKAGKPKRKYKPIVKTEGLAEAAIEAAKDEMKKIIRIPGKMNRSDARRELGEKVIEALKEKYPDNELEIFLALEELEKKLMREMILNEGHRIDNRSGTDIRPINIEVSMLPRAHGSALFTRGETQSLTAITLGTKLDEQKIEDLEGGSFKSFLLHYNFPPFSVGEVGRMFSPGRREVGHGHLAERALIPVVPVDKVFPYTIRVVSDVLESNGSSSMATVCASSLALMDAGVPIKTHVAGIAMGLIKEGDKFVVLSDIIGAEDHNGDMDFKVTGTKDGITAFQMDIKVPGIPFAVLEQALSQAKQGREHILQKMSEVLPAPRKELSPHAPRMTLIHIKPDKIGEVIGTGGKIIRSIQEQTGTTIAIEDDGTIFISAVNPEGMEAAIKMIEEIVVEPEVGQIIEGVVTKIAQFGAFVKIGGSTEGLLHISEIEHRRIERVEDVLSVGDKVTVKVLAVDPVSGKIRLSHKVLIPR